METWKDRTEEWNNKIPAKKWKVEISSIFKCFFFLLIGGEWIEGMKQVHERGSQTETKRSHFFKTMSLPYQSENYYHSSY